jgi:DNA-binding LacI/PurR family transcriptional regulator
MKTIRLADVARSAGVSQGTASNVFNRPHLVSEGVRSRVEAAAQALGYAGPDPKARLLRAGKVNAIGVVTAEPLSYFFDDPFARVLLSGISQACDAASAGLALVSAMSEERLAWNIQSAVVDGFILCCIKSGMRLVALTRERKLPFVALDLGTSDETISAIGVDDFGGGAAAARHLAALGHRRLAILTLSMEEQRMPPVSSLAIGTAEHRTSRDRLNGYRAGLAAFGIDPANIPVVGTQNDEPTVKSALAHLFTAERPPTAILAMSDKAAMIALDWLRGRGLAVPGDVSVVGFDGVPEGARCFPALTTVAQPIREMGHLAVRTILEDRSAARRKMLDFAFVVRDSSAHPPDPDEQRS